MSCDDLWLNICQKRDECDEKMKHMNGVTFFFSSVAALERRSKARRASREHKAEPWKKLLGVLSDKAQTLQYDRTFHSKQSHDFCFSILTVFGGKMTSQC